MPIGTSTRPRVDDLAGEGEDLGALAARRCRTQRYAVAPLAMIHGTLAQGLDVVDDGRLAPEAGHGRERRPEPRHAALALDGGDERRLLAADEGAGALLDPEPEVPAAAQRVVAQQAALLGGGDRELSPAAQQTAGGPFLEPSQGDQRPVTDRTIGLLTQLHRESVNSNAFGRQTPVFVVSRAGDVNAQRAVDADDPMAGARVVMLVVRTA